MSKLKTTTTFNENAMQKLDLKL